MYRVRHPPWRPLHRPKADDESFVDRRTEPLDMGVSLESPLLSNDGESIGVAATGQIRKKIKNTCISFLLWLAYLMADWVAAFGIGLISHNQGNLSTHTIEVDRALQAFWVSFLFLHLGGPDTITAYAMEDSSLWLRHMLSLIFQVAAAIYVFIHIFLSDKSLVIPTMLVFLAAVIKNVERTLALNLSSLQRVKESPLTIYTSSDDEYFEWDIERDKAYKGLVKELDDLGYGYLDIEEAKLPETIMVKHAHSFFQMLKAIIGDFMLTCDQRDMSREYFYKISAVDALRVISVELHFMYEVLHTKALVIRSKWSYIFRFIAFTSIVIALVLFNRLKKHRLPKLTVEITYTLLLGGIALDVIALFMLIFSDWIVAGKERDSFIHKLVSAMYNLRKPRFVTYKPKRNAKVTYAVLDTPFIFRRWSESVPACNIFSMSFKKRPRKMYKCDRHWGFIVFSNICKFSSRMTEKIISFFRQAGSTIAKGCGLETRVIMIENTRYVSKNPLINKLWVFIFEEIKRKSKDANDLSEVKEIFEARGALSLKNSNAEIDCENLLKMVTDGIFNYSIVHLHIVTEVLYNKECSFTAPNDEREFSKILSDYMLYLLLNQSKVMSTVVGVSRALVAAILFNLENLKDHTIEDVEGLCKTLADDSWVNKGRFIVDWEDEATEMEKLGERKWEVMSRMWVEMLSYAAVHIQGEVHVQVLSKGGELLAFVWLLMVHFGCYYKPDYDMCW
ncbi:uncharacterized protein LOC104430776 [Eucalyptus grandis]|uniref:uncharacterized protein LOC104430776 n=1 Tax=Eucalyptus grandis TaxID=71139 RepID=UPI00192ECD59|nr:uncharacterized protein LOC104430776 [Eucalyptus grandis]